MSDLSSSSRVVGRVIRVITGKTISFLWCWTPPKLVQCIVLREISATPVVGSFIAVTGTWQPYGGKRAGFAPQEIVVERVQILAVPTNSQIAQQHWSNLDQLILPIARGKALAAAEHYLRTHSFSRIETPIVVGSQATMGTTAPFVIQAAQEKAYLTVNNLIWQHEYQQSGLTRIYEVSRLLWAQRYSDRFSLNEISLLEYSIAGADRQAIMTMTEELLEEVRHALLEVLGEYDGKRPTLARSHLNLPVLTFAEVIERAVHAGLQLSSVGHVLPSIIDGIVAEQLGTPGFWLIDSPANTSPFYTRRIARNGSVIGCSVELRMASVPNVGSGSEWVYDPEMGEAIIKPWRETLAGRHYLAILRRGLPPCTGFTLGLDRLLMHLLEVSNIRLLVSQARDRHSFRDAPPVIEQERALVEPARFTKAPPVAALIRSSQRVARACKWLTERDFTPCLSSLLAAPWSSVLARQAPSVETDYFGRAVPLVVDRAPLHHEILFDGLPKIFDVGPVATGAPWWRPDWNLDVSWIDPALSELQDMAINLMQLLTEMEDRDQLFVTAVQNLSPTSLMPIEVGQPGYIRNSYRGPTAAGFTWSWQGQLILRGGLWLHEEAQLEAALGSFALDDRCRPLRTFLSMAPPPAGGISINLSAFPGIEWGPPFVVSGGTATDDSRHQV